MVAPTTNTAVELENAYRISPDIQIALLGEFVKRTNTIQSKKSNGAISRRSLLLIRDDMLKSVLAQVELKLQTDACAIYISDSSGLATLRAARGYQEPKVGKSVRNIYPSTEVMRMSGGQDKIGLTSWVISTGRSFLAEKPGDFYEHPHFSGTFDKHLDSETSYENKPISAFLAIPLRDSRGQVIGALKAQRFEPGQPFSVENQITLEALGQVAGRCITYANDAAAGSLDAAITSWALKIFADASSTEGELDTFLDIAVRVAAAVTLADACSVFVVDEESGRTLTQRAGCGHQSLKNTIRSYLIPDRSQLAGCVDFSICSPETCKNRVHNLPDEEKVGITAWVAATGKSFYAHSKEELRQHCYHKGQFDPHNFEPLVEECSAWFGIPLVTGATSIGVLKIENKTPIGEIDGREFSMEVKQRLEILGQDIAISIRRLQIQGKTRYEVINKAMPTILAILEGGLEIPKLVELVVNKTANLFNARACALFLKEGNKLIQPPWAAYGYAGKKKGSNKEDADEKSSPVEPLTVKKKEDEKKIREYDLVPLESIVPNPSEEQKKGLTVWIAVTQKGFLARSNLELKLHPHHQGKYDPINFEGQERCESFMGRPLLAGKELIGVLKVETKQREVAKDKYDYSYFNEQDALVFTLIANSVAIAIQNARLLASRRLADRLLAPSVSLMLPEVFKFIEDRVDVLNTLEGAKQIIADRDLRKAKLLESLIGILRPNFNPTFLEQFSHQLLDPSSPVDASFSRLLELMLRTIEVNSWEEIHKIKSIEAVAPDWYDSQFALSDCAQLLLETHKKISEYLKAYDLDSYKILNLKACMETLKAQIKGLDAQNLFTRNILQKIFNHWLVLIEAEYTRQHDIRNPYTAAKPLDAGSEVFFGREDTFRWIETHLQEQKGILILHGGWHTGKTSILKQITGGPAGEKIRERHAALPVYIDLQRISDPGKGVFLLSLTDFIGKALDDNNIPKPKVDEDGFIKSDQSSRLFNKYLDDVNQRIHQHEKKILLIMLDEFELLYKRVKENMMGIEIFDYLRSLMQHEFNVSFILAGRHRLDEMDLDVRTPIFNVAYHQEISFLGIEEAKRLIVEPVRQFGVEYEEASVDRILKLTAGHPYFIQQICKNCIDVLNQRKSGYTVTDEILTEAIKVSLAHNATLEELWKRELDDKDRELIGKLAELISRGEEGWVKESELLDASNVSQQELVTSLQKPIVQKLIQARSMKGADLEYSFGVDLLREWISQQATPYFRL